MLPALAWLDDVLARAAEQVPRVFGSHVVGDRYRGLYVSAADAEQLLKREPGAPFGVSVSEAHELIRLRREAVAPGTRLHRIVDAYSLSDFDVDVLLLALAPELDRRYERLYAYLQDDVSARRPTVDLALQLFAADAAERLSLRRRFAPNEPLLAGCVIMLDAGAPGVSLLTHAIRLDDQITNELLGHDWLDRRLLAFCRYAPRPAADSELSHDMVNRLRRYVLAQAGASDFKMPILQFVGAAGSGRRTAAAALAASLDRQLLIVDLARIAADPDAETLLRLVLREAWLRDAALYCDGADVLRQQESHVLLGALLSVSRVAPRAAILGLTDGAGDLAPSAPTIALPRPSFERRRALWSRAAARCALDVDSAGVEQLAARFELSPRQIRHAAAEASAQQQLLSLGESRAVAESRDLALLCAAARRQSATELSALSTRIEPVHTFDDLVLPPDATAQLRELCDRVERRAVVMDAWGFGQCLTRGKGVNALFSGPPGTGKTMAAEVVAHTLGVDLFRVELAGVVSKYIGETEKNLDRIFAAAEHANAVILFDEADALFGKRSEVHDAHDRYANIEISYLLQRMEEYGGVAILSTNLRGNLDAAFMRRLSFTIHFPLPDVASRRRIWEHVWPNGVPRAQDLALELVAAQFTISGGHIRNIALAAAYLAATDGGVVTMRHLLYATAREYQKLGKALGENDLAPFNSWSREWLPQSTPGVAAKRNGR